MNDPLTHGSILPHLRIIAQLPSVDIVLFATIERDRKHELDERVLDGIRNVRHIPLFSQNIPINLLNKIYDFLLFPKLLKQVVLDHNITDIIAFSTPAASLVHLLTKQLNLTYYVAFYEPHAAYMLETGIWGRYDPRYIYQKKWEKEQARDAKGLLAVSEAFRQEISSNSLAPASKIRVVRNAVDMTKFLSNPAKRSKVKYNLGIAAETTVGVYVGKFGGLYFEEDAFAIYQSCFELISNFSLLILTPQEHVVICENTRRTNLDEKKIFVLTVPHQEVPDYLSAADFAFATIKSYPSARYCSPVKIGEYWASGLPVLLTEGVGDDSDIIKNEGGGALFNVAVPGSVEKAILQIQEIINQPGHREEIRKLAIKYRSPDRIKEAYEYFFGANREVS